jgi:hypothetical protein
MAQLTLLQMVQNILSAMSSDEVNSIADTVESMQVATIIMNKYYDIVARGDLTLDCQLFQLNPSDNTASPVQMTMPAGSARIDWLQYYDTNPQDSLQTDQFGSFSHDLNLDIVSTIKWTTTSTSSVTIVNSGPVTFTVGSSTLPIIVGQLVQCTSGNHTMIGNVAQYTGTTLVVNVTSSSGTGTFSSWVINNVSVTNVPPGYKYVTVVPIDYFLEITNKFDLSQPEFVGYIFVQGGLKYNFRYANDRQPSICTVVSNRFVLFDSYDNTQDGTLQASKTLVYGQIIPPFLLQDSFIPTLDDLQFSLLLNESKSLAFYELKQMPHAKADQEINRQWAVVQKTKSVSNKPSYFDQLMSFGRVPRTGGYGLYPPNRWMRNNVGSSL